MADKNKKISLKDKQKEKTIKKFIQRKGGTRGIIGDHIRGMGAYSTGGKVPKGYHRMPNGKLMKDSAMKKKMGGGMMRPMKAAGGAAISAIAAGAGAIGAAGLRANKKIADRAKEKKKKNAMKNMKDVSKNNLPKKKMGGGMMKQPMGYNTGGEAKVRGMGAAIRGGKFQGVF